MTDISVLIAIATLDTTATEYWNANEYHLQAQTLAAALHMVHLSTSRVYDRNGGAPSS